MQVASAPQRNEYRLGLGDLESRPAPQRLNPEFDLKRGDSRFNPLQEQRN
jgi:hypothetical protein